MEVLAKLKSNSLLMANSTKGSRSAPKIYSTHYVVHLPNVLFLLLDLSRLDSTITTLYSRNSPVK